MTSDRSTPDNDAPLALLFDIGGVLAEAATFDALGTFLEALGQSPDPQKLRDRWLRSEAVRAFETGRVRPEVFARAFLAEWELPLSAEDFLAEFASWVRQPYPGTEELLARLRERHTVACLSNSNELHWGRYTGFLGCFDRAFSSHLLGELKPDPRAFHLVIAELHVSPGEVRFFDDSRLNVEAARRLGVESFLVDGLPETRAALRSQGLL